jgi:hypothetical protein
MIAGCNEIPGEEYFNFGKCWGLCLTEVLKELPLWVTMWTLLLLEGKEENIPG